MTSTIASITPDTVAAVARIHLAAFPGSESAGLGYRYAQAFIRWFQHQPKAIALVAFVDRMPCGYVVGAPRTCIQHLYRDLLPVAAVGALARPWTILRRDVREMARARLKMIIRRNTARVLEPEPADATMVLNAIAVTHLQRHRGVGYDLLAAFEAEAIARQMQTLVLSVLRNNDVAKRLYESRRWRPFAEESRLRLRYCLSLRDVREQVVIPP